MIYYDNTMLSSFRECKRKYFFRFICNLVPDTKDSSKIFGLAWHKAMDYLWEKAAEKDDGLLVEGAAEEFVAEWNKLFEGEIVDLEELYPRTPDRAKDMLQWYVKTYAERIREYEILGVEKLFAVPLIEDTFYCGRLDKIVKDKFGNVYTIDHKTTSFTLSKYEATVLPDTQVEGYNYHGLLTYEDAFKGTILDIAVCQTENKKDWRHPVYPPGIDFGTVSVLAEEGAVSLWAWETMYAVIVLDQHENELLQQCSPDDLSMNAFDRNVKACNLYRGCEYRALCMFNSNPIKFIQGDAPAGFRKEPWTIPAAIAEETKKGGEDEYVRVSDR